MIESLIKGFPGKAIRIERNGTLSGIALGREGYKYHHIGPVMATNTDDSKVLISQALNSLVGQAVVVDVLCDKEELVAWLRTIGFVEQRKFIRMYKHINPFPGAVDKQFLICGPEFG